MQDLALPRLEVNHVFTLGMGRHDLKMRTMDIAEIDQTLDEWHEEMTTLRRDLHSHPELAFEEHRTSSFIKGKLEQWHIEVASGIAHTGIVGIIRGRQTGAQAIGLRAAG